MITIKTEIKDNEGKVNIKLVYPKTLKGATENEKIVASEISRYLDECLKNYIEIGKGE